MEKGLVFGLSIGDLLEIYDHDSQSWKMSGCLFTGDYARSSGPLRKSGMMRNGKHYEVVSLDCPISGHGCGLFPTPNAALGLPGMIGEFCHKSMTRKEMGESRPSGAKIGSCLKWDRRVIPYLIHNRPNPELCEWMMGYPKQWTDYADSETRLSLK